MLLLCREKMVGVLSLSLQRHFTTPTCFYANGNAASWWFKLKTTLFSFTMRQTYINTTKIYFFFKINKEKSNQKVVNSKELNVLQRSLMVNFFISVSLGVRIVKHWQKWFKNTCFDTPQTAHDHKWWINPHRMGYGLFKLINPKMMVWSQRWREAESFVVQKVLSMPSLAVPLWLQPQHKKMKVNSLI